MDICICSLSQIVDVNMPSCPCGDIVRLGEVALCHCWTRCVRRALLCGQDANTGKDYEYRREWIRDFEETLAALFGIEVGFHAELRSDRKITVAFVSAAER